MTNYTWFTTDIITCLRSHDDVIKLEYFPRYWPFVRGIHHSSVNSPHRGQWRGALMFFVICAWINGWVNDREAGDMRRHKAYYDVIVTKSLLVRVVPGKTYWYKMYCKTCFFIETHEYKSYLKHSRERWSTLIIACSWAFGLLCFRIFRRLRERKNRHISKSAQTKNT